MIFKFLDKNTLEVVKKSFHSIIVRLIGLICNFGISVILARALGPSGLGILNLSNQIISIVLIFIIFGVNNIIIKEVSIAYNNKNFSKISSIIASAFYINIPLSLFFTFLSFFFSSFIAKNIFGEYLIEMPLIILSGVLLFQVIITVLSSGIIGIGKIWQGKLMNELSNSIIVIFGLCSLILLEIKINLINVAAIYALARILVAISSIFYWNSNIKFSFKLGTDVKKLASSSFPLLIVSVSWVLASSIDTIMLGIITNTSQIGLYNVAFKLGMITTIVHATSITALKPKIAFLFNQNKFDELNSLVQKITKILVCISIFITLIFIFFGKLFLSVWGSEFVSAYYALIIISFGQLFNVGTGASGAILMMTGHEKVLGFITFFSAILNCILNYFLISKYGFIGAAIATSLVVAVLNVIQLVFLKKKLNISIL